MNTLQINTDPLIINCVDPNMLPSATSTEDDDVKPILDNSIARLSITSLIEHLLDNKTCGKNYQTSELIANNSIDLKCALNTKIDVNKLFTSLDNTSNLQLSNKDNFTKTYPTPSTSTQFAIPTTNASNRSLVKVHDDLYPSCFIKHDSKNLTYNCCNCSFSTTNVEDAALHFLNNQSESNSYTLLRYNTNTCLYRCGSCSFTTNIDNRAVEHWGKHHFRAIFQCFICSFVNRDEDTLKTHIICHLNEKNQNDKEFSCVKCNIKISSLEDFELHYYRSHGRKRFICTICNENFYYGSDLKKHIADLHIEKPNSVFKCLHCGAVIKHRNTFITHMRVHVYELSKESFDTKATILQSLAASQPKTNEVTKNSQIYHINNEYKCRFCSFSAVLMKYLKNHLKTEHSDKRQYIPCDICNSSFSSKRSLKMHVKSIHESKVVECSECDFKTRHKLSLKTHMEYHTGQLSQLCYICGFQSADAKSMNIHIFRHSDIKYLSCHVCNFRGNTNSALSKHLLSHGNERQYACDICHFRTKTKAHLKHHKLTHMATKPFQCYCCTYSCISKTTLIQHIATHLSTREPYSCPNCDKTYLTKNSLKLHELTHQVIPFTCTMCPAVFSKPRVFENHMKLHTGVGLMYCFHCKYSSTHKSNFIEHVTKTCTKAKPFKEYMKYCYRCGYASSHRSNFIHHVTKTCQKLKLKNTS